MSVIYFATLLGSSNGAGLKALLTAKKFYESCSRASQPGRYATTRLVESSGDAISNAPSGRVCKEGWKEVRAGVYVIPHICLRASARMLRERGG